MNDLLDFNKEEFVNALNNRDVNKIRDIVENYNLVDIAETLNELESITDYMFVFKYIPPEYTADVFAYLDQEKQESLIKLLTGTQLKDLIDNLYSDDLVDFMQEMPANLTTKILQATPKDRRAEINQLLSYEEDTAGSIMTTEFIMLKESMHMKEALAKIKSEAQDAETISYLYVVDNSRVLKGVLRLKDILFMEDNQTIEDIMDTDFTSVFATDDQESVANTFKKYDLNAIPVTTKDFRLVGIVTSDDIIDVIEQEATEDIHMMANINPLEDEYMKTNAFKLALKATPWIILLMLLATFTTLIMNQFEDAMLAVPCLSIFIPMLIGTAGNNGNQSSTLIVRALGLNEITKKDYIRVCLKELLTSLLVGVAVSIVNCLWIYFLGSTGIIDLSASPISPFKLGLVVGSAMLICIIVAKFIGSSIPLLCSALKIDPALLSGPMVTTLVDASSIIIYFVIATKLFGLI